MCACSRQLVFSWSQLPRQQGLNVQWKSHSAEGFPPLLSTGQCRHNWQRRCHQRHMLCHAVPAKHAKFRFFFLRNACFPSRRSWEVGSVNGVRGVIIIIIRHHVLGASCGEKVAIVTDCGSFGQCPQNVRPRARISVWARDRSESSSHCCSGSLLLVCVSGDDWLCFATLLFVLPSSEWFLLRVNHRYMNLDDGDLRNIHVLFLVSLFESADNPEQNLRRQHR